MYLLRWGSCIVVAVMMCGLQGCGKAELGPVGTPVVPVAGTPVASPPANPVPATATPTAVAPATAAATPATAPAAAAPIAVTALGQVDPAIQKRLMEIGAKLPKEDSTGGPSFNDLKQIGLAFHNFHDAQGGFPALNGMADKEHPDHNKLSWRVWLLPFLDQGPLFEEFHLNESWDSPHNIKLVARMPREFGVSPEGKTRLHLLTGNGAPFKNDARTQVREITDGTSNTILAIVGGPDTAEIWTKPGGREFDPKDPLKSLGNVGETFQVVFMDGSARTIFKSVTAETFANIARHADGNVVADIPGPGTGAGRPGSFKIHDPVTPLAAPAPKLALNFIPDDAFAAFAVHPRRVYEHPVVQSIRKLVPNFKPDSLHNDLPYDVARAVSSVFGLRNEYGIAAEHVDELIVLLDKSLLDTMTSDNPQTIPPFGLILKHSAPLDVEGIVKKWTTLPESTASVEEFEGVALILIRPTVTERANSDRLVVSFVSDSMMLFGAESVVKKMIAARSKTTANTGLTKQMEAVGNPLFAVVADAEPIAKSLRSVLKDVPPPMALFTPYIAGAQTVNLTWDLDAAAMLNVSLKFKTPELAQGLFGMLDQQFQAIKQQYDATKPGLKQNPGLSGVVPYADQVLTETKLTNAGETIALTIPRIQNIEKLIDLLRPGFEGANRAAAQIMRKNEMKKIGLAFHNFESSFSHFPAHNGQGEESKPNRGLSWRVYLLPYLGEYGLYNKFHLDEPWDSPANRELIKLMPETYGKNAEGKTSIHVLSGAGTPFASDKPTKISDFTDGLSNCILAVEAGADTAEIWTKPGGRAFDPADPLKSLGNVTEFYALMGDGAVRLMKNVDKETFRKLVQHADGETIDEIP